MKQTLLDSELVFRDLADALERLRSAEESPVVTRRTFREFVFLSQQLTEVLRKEYMSFTGQAWNAGSFIGWTPTTALFKKLRRSEFHEYPFFVHVRRQHTIPATRFMPNAPSNLQIVVEGVTMTDQLAEVIPPPGLSLRRPTSPGQEGEKLEWSGVTNRLFIEGRNKEVRRALEMAGTDEVIPLAESCFRTLLEYYTWYRQQVTAAVPQIQDFNWS